jgi:hypothetical protein
MWLAVPNCAHLSEGWAQKLAQSSGVGEAGAKAPRSIASAYVHIQNFAENGFGCSDDRLRQGCNEARSLSGRQFLPCPSVVNGRIARRLGAG